MVTILARERSVDRPRTKWTDSNGRVLDEYGLSGFCINALRDARTAGVPTELLHSSGWNGDESSIRGIFAHYVYVMADFLSTVERDISRIEDECLKPLAAICRNTGADYKAAMATVFDAARLLRDLRDAQGVKPLAPEVVEAMSAEYDAVMDDWGCPSGPGHPKHAHGLSNGSWMCLSA